MKLPYESKSVIAKLQLVQAFFKTEGLSHGTKSSGMILHSFAARRARSMDGPRASDVHGSTNAANTGMYRSGPTHKQRAYTGESSFWHKVKRPDHF